MVPETLQQDNATAVTGKFKSESEKEIKIFSCTDHTEAMVMQTEDDQSNNYLVFNDNSYTSQTVKREKSKSNSPCDYLSL